MAKVMAFVERGKGFRFDHIFPPFFAILKIASMAGAIRNGSE
jgi:hypothetical protein